MSLATSTISDELSATQLSDIERLGSTARTALSGQTEQIL
jgi:hypothetical protein